MGALVAIDAGTTGIRALAFDEGGVPGAISYRELRQTYPRPGWVEQDPAEMWTLVRESLAEVVRATTEPIAAIGITNQRETAVAWDRRSGRPLHNAVVWQDRRTAARCDALRDAGLLPLVRERTGLVLDPYFSATKFEWLLGEGGLRDSANLALGTVDAWVLWNLTGGPDGGAHCTDVSNASRTMLYDIGERGWSGELCSTFGVSPSLLPEVVPSSGRIGVSAPGVAGDLPAGTPVSGVAGDQQAALFGQACYSPGMAKNTYGTGSFVVMNVGPSCPPPTEGLLSTVAWQLEDGGELSYALEGSIFVTGATVQWLRDELGLIGDASELEPLAKSVEDAGGAYIVPAFTGLGSPWWDPYARGVVVGLSRGVGRAHLARAALEAMVFQTDDVISAMAAARGEKPSQLRVDGGASVMDTLLQLQADQSGIPVARPAGTETTAAGAVFLAGLAEGTWGSLAELSALWRADRTFEPSLPPEEASRRSDGWRRALARSRSWAPR